MEKKSFKVVVVVLILLLFSGGLYLVENIFNGKFEYNGMYSESIIDEEIPVINVENKIIKPFTSDNIKELVSFYEYNSDNQENSIIYYDNTYIQSTGIIFGSDSEFDVVSILDGEVIKVEDNELLGKVIEIKHSDNLVSIYQCLKDVVVKENDIIKQGDIIGKSTNSNLTDKSDNILYFELINNGEIVNPNNYFDKSINEL